jgi:hypothetical protein
MAMTRTTRLELTDAVPLQADHSARGDAAAEAPSATPAAE